MNIIIKRTIIRSTACSFAALGAFFAVGLNAANAATLVFTGTPTQIANVSPNNNILNDGISFVSAFNVGSTTDAVIQTTSGALTFSGATIVGSGAGSTQSLTQNGVTMTVTTTGNFQTTTNNPYTASNLSTLLNSYAFSGASDGQRTVLLELTGLTPNLNYRLQLMHYQGNASSNIRQMWIANVADGTNASEVFAPGNAAGEGLISFVYWTADSTSQSIAVLGLDGIMFNRSTLDGVALHVVPEPGTSALVGLTAFIALMLRRRR